MAAVRVLPLMLARPQERNSVSIPLVLTTQAAAEVTLNRTRLISIVDGTGLPSAVVALARWTAEPEIKPRYYAVLAKIETVIQQWPNTG